MLKFSQRRELMSLLGDTLSWNCCLTKIVLRNINADTASCQALCTGLETNRSHCISVIDLSQNPKIGDRGVSGLAMILAKFGRGLTSLNLNNVGLTPKGELVYNSIYNDEFLLIYFWIIFTLFHFARKINEQKAIMLELVENFGWIFRTYCSQETWFFCRF